MSENQLALPDWLKAKIDQGEVTADADKVVSAVESVPRISLKSRRFNFIENGEVVMKTADPIPVVIVGVQPENGMAKTYYEGDYQPGDNSPPDCSSFDGIKPDSWITTPQAESCATCPNNKWGSAKSMSGGKAKACRDSKRLIVINAKNIKESTAFTLNVTVASLKPLSDFGKQLAKQGIPLEAVITMIGIDEDSDFSKLTFTAAGVLNETQGLIAITRANERDWDSDLPAVEHQTSSAPAVTNQPASSAAPAPEVATPAPPAAAAATPAADDDMDKLLESW
jgi:hypothetical protein